MATKSSIYAFQKNPTMVDYPGHLAAVFFTSGCNFRCGFCHNAGLLAEQQAGMTFDKLEDVCEKFSEQWVDGVVISGGEPTLAPDLPVLVGLFRSYGFKVKLDTNGSHPEVIDRLLCELDYVAMDVKCSAKSYPELTRFDRVDRIEKSIHLLKNHGNGHEFRSTVIESFHTDDELKAMGEMIRGANRYVLQPFVPRDDLPDEALRSAKRTSPDRMKAVAAMMDEYADEVIFRQ